ncbi:MAG: polyprenyl synthetase family protein [Pseudomonadota bacterium]
MSNFLDSMEVDMEMVARVEACLEEAIEHATAPSCPPKLAKAVQYAVFPGGARVRPQLCVSIAAACGSKEERIADGAAAAIELLHCASLVHDDLPCFDDADTRRGKASVHKLYGEPIAVLAGDALIVEAFNTICRTSASRPETMAQLIRCTASAVGMPSGIVAGQAWESEQHIDIKEYHRAKTGSLFVCAVSAGAIAAGQDPKAWCPLGDLIGSAYQIADDLMDAVGLAEECDKPVSQDLTLSRPNAVAKYGVDGAMSRLRKTIQDAVDSIPDCKGASELRGLIMAQATRLVPAKLAKSAA